MCDGTAVRKRIYRARYEDAGKRQDPEIEQRDKNAYRHTSSRTTRTQFVKSVAFALDARR